MSQNLLVEWQENIRERTYCDRTNVPAERLQVTLVVILSGIVSLLWSDYWLGLALVRNSFPDRLR